MSELYQPTWHIPGPKLCSLLRFVNTDLAIQSPASRWHSLSTATLQWLFHYEPGPSWNSLHHIPRAKKDKWASLHFSLDIKWVSTCWLSSTSSASPPFRVTGGFLRVAVMLICLCGGGTLFSAGGEVLTGPTRQEHTHNSILKLAQAAQWYGSLASLLNSELIKVASLPVFIHLRVLNNRFTYFKQHRCLLHKSSCSYLHYMCINVTLLTFYAY